MHTNHNKWVRDMLGLTELDAKMQLPSIPEFIHAAVSRVEEILARRDVRHNDFRWDVLALLIYVAEENQRLEDRLREIERKLSVAFPEPKKGKTSG